MSGGGTAGGRSRRDRARAVWRAVLPVGGRLAPDLWRRRHRWIVRLLWLHVPVVLGFGLARGVSASHLLFEVTPIILLAFAADQLTPHRHVAAAVAAAGLATCSAVLVHLSGGNIEMHFHFFVMVGVVTLYQDWAPFLVSIAYVVTHHTVIGSLEPQSVFNHPSALERPAIWALVHGGFILAMSAVGVASWRLNEVTGARLADREQKLAHAQQIAQLGSWEWDVATDQVAWSPELYGLFGVDERGFSPSYEGFLARVHPDDRDMVATTVAHTFETLEPLSYDFRAVLPDGSVRWMHGQGEVVADDGGTPTAIYGTAHDITARKLAERDLAHLAHHDPLTALPNRSLLIDRLGQALHQLDRHPGPLAVLFMDLDGFKVINDSLGHNAGDRILVQLADRLQAAVRAGDTVARFGGDEFAVLCPALARESDAVALAERIADIMAAPFQLDPAGEFVVTASIGITFADDPRDDPADVLRDADLAMYRAKDLGRAGYAIFDASMHRAAHERLALGTDLRRAVEGGELVLHYQPQVVLVGDGGIAGVEALLRWAHPERGLVSPLEFIPVAESTGLINPMGTWVIQEACRQLGEWQRQGRPDLAMCVNVSARQLVDPAIVDVVAGALEASGVNPSTLCLEITESVLMEEPDHYADTLSRLKDLGVGLSVDDFGTGYSSLAYLQVLPADFLKIDRSFVSALGESPRAAAIVRTIIDLAHSLDLGCVAEGVETEAQAAELTRLGCDQAQGFLFARPAPAEAIAPLLVARQVAPT